MKRRRTNPNRVRKFARKLFIGELVKKQAPKQQKNYREYKIVLREDFQCRCAYCMLAEKHAGQSFEIDHYQPPKGDKTLEADYANLMWCCRKCNGKKSNHNPEPEGTRRLLKCDEDNPKNHYEIDYEQGELLGKSKLAQLTIELLRLNQEELTKTRILIGGNVLQLLQAEMGQVMSSFPDDRTDYDESSLSRLERLVSEFEQLNTELESVFEVNAAKLLDPEFRCHPNT